jgi:hypothetical protein
MRQRQRIEYGNVRGQGKPGLIFGIAWRLLIQIQNPLSAIRVPMSHSEPKLTFSNLGSHTTIVIQNLNTFQLVFPLLPSNTRNSWECPHEYVYALIGSIPLRNLPISHFSQVSIVNHAINKTHWRRP